MDQTRANYATISTEKIRDRPRILYSRSSDGNPSGPIVVEVLPDGTYRTGRGVYPTSRQLLIGLTHHPEGRHWTFDRYFRLGRYAISEPIVRGHESPIMALFGAPTAITTLAPVGPTITGGFASPNLLTVSPPGPNRNGLGIDLQKRAGEVAKLLFAGYSRRIYAWGYDPDDVLQEVYKGILVRNNGRCPWDAKKSSFGHYVHLVCGCLLSNYHRKERRRRAVEQVGMAAFTNDGYVNVDAADACATRVECATYLDTTSMVGRDFIDFMCQRVDAMGVTKEGRQMALQVLPLALEGHGRQDIAAALNVPLSQVARALKTIKTAMAEWSLSPFLG